MFQRVFIWRVLQHIDNVALVLVVKVRVFAACSEFVILLSLVGDFDKFFIELFDMFETGSGLFDEFGVVGFVVKDTHEEGFDDVEDLLAMFLEVDTVVVHQVGFLKLLKQGFDVRNDRHVGQIVIGKSGGISVIIWDMVLCVKLDEVLGEKNVEYFYTEVVDSESVKPNSWVKELGFDQSQHVNIPVIEVLDDKLQLLIVLNLPCISQQTFYHPFAYLIMRNVLGDYFLAR